jgi:hypothetical protein
MITFKNIQEEHHNIKETIESVFSVELELNGGWGYNIDNATSIEAIKDSMPINQLEHMLISMRTHLEMNITQDEEHRYAGINANELQRERVESNELIYDKVSYEISAIKEGIYTKFIKEYKKGYGKEEFDISEHFKRRKEATLTREVIYYFEVSKVI